MVFCESFIAELSKDVEGEAGEVGAVAGSS